LRDPKKVIIFQTMSHAVHAAFLSPWARVLLVGLLLRLAAR